MTSRAGLLPQLGRGAGEQEPLGHVLLGAGGWDCVPGLRTPRCNAQLSTGLSDAAQKHQRDEPPVHSFILVFRSFT